MRDPLNLTRPTSPVDVDPAYCLWLKSVAIKGDTQDERVRILLAISSGIKKV